MQLIFEGPSGGGGGRDPQTANDFLRQQLEDALKNLLQQITQSNQYQGFLKKQDQDKAFKQKDIDRGQVLHWVVSIIRRDLNILAKSRGEDTLQKVEKDLSSLRGLHALRMFREHEKEWNDEALKHDKQEIKRIVQDFMAEQEEDKARHKRELDF